MKPADAGDEWEPVVDQDGHPFLVEYLGSGFLASDQGNEVVSNSYSPRLRHAFISYNKWTFGQTWMTFFNVGALPENLDFVGPAESTIFGRQAMVRYTMGNWQFAAENPETTVTPFGGGGGVQRFEAQAPVIRLGLGGR